MRKGHFHLSGNQLLLLQQRYLLGRIYEEIVCQHLDHAYSHQLDSHI